VAAKWVEEFNILNLKKNDLCAQQILMCEPQKSINDRESSVS
jgi:hypothetical protein